MRISLSWRRHLGTLAMVAVALLGAHAWQTRQVPSGPAPDFSALAVSTQDGAVLGLARIFHACSQRRAQRGIAARI